MFLLSLTYSYQINLKKPVGLLRALHFLELLPLNRDVNLFLIQLDIDSHFEI